MFCLLVTKIKKTMLGHDHLHWLSDFNNILSGPMERTFFDDDCMQSNRTKLNEELHLCFVFWERKPILLLNLEELRRIILWQWMENQAAASWKLVPWFFNETKFDLYLFVCLTLGSNHLVSLWTYWKIKNANEPRKIRPSNFFSKIVCHT